MTASHDVTLDDASASRNPMEIVAEEFTEALRAGMNPSIEAFADRCPNDRVTLVAILKSIALVERAGSSENARLAAEVRWHRFNQSPIQTLGDFRIVREIGRGGMGMIFEAEQISLKRLVALKILNPGFADSKKQLERFRRESVAIARLHHTNIVPVFAIGEEDGIHYFAMQLIDGHPLSNDLKLTPVVIAQLGVQACSAIAYAHEHGVLHRDIKPSNLLLDRNGQLWVTDFGLAKITNDSELTQDGDIMGTVRYMAPEQLEGRSDARSDIYALGLTLYELLAGRPAFDASSSLAERIRNQDVKPLRKLNAAVPRDLETIVMKATAREASLRYQSAEELLGDLRCFVEDRPILARRASVIEIANRWMRRNPVVALSAATTFCALVIATALSGWGYWTTTLALNRAEQASRESLLAKELAENARVRAESNLNLAVEAFDAIFDNIAGRGVPQSLSFELDTNVVTAESGDNSADATGASNTAERHATSIEAERFQSTLTSADTHLLTDLLAFYRKFVERNGEDPSLLIRTARAYHKSGQIQQRLGQWQESLASLDEAVSLIATRLAKDRDATLFVILSQIMNDRGLVLLNNSTSIPDAVAHHMAAAELLRSLPEPARTLPEVRFELARSRDLAGSVLSRKGVTNAELSVSEGPRIAPPERGMVMESMPPPGTPGVEQLNKERIDVERTRRERPGVAFGPFGMGPFGMGPIYIGPLDMGPHSMGPHSMGPPGMGPPGMGPPGMGPPRDAFAYPIPKLVRDLLPKDSDFDFGRPPGPPRDMPTSGRGRPMGPSEFSGMGPPPGDRGNPEADGPRGPLFRGPRGRGPEGLPPDIALRIDRELNEAIDLLSGLTEEFADNEEYQLVFAQVQRHRMQHLLFTRRHDEASRAFDSAKNTLQKLVDQNPKNPRYLLELADTLSYAGSRMREIDAVDAETYMKRSADISEQLCAAFPQVVEYQAMLAAAMEKLGTHERNRRRWEAAAAYQKVAYQTLQRLTEQQPTNLYFQSTYFVSLNNWARLLLDSHPQVGTTADLSECRQQLVLAMENLRADDPESRKFQMFGRQMLARIDRRLNGPQ